MVGTCKQIICVDKNCHMAECFPDNSTQPGSEGEDILSDVNALYKKFSLPSIACVFDLEWLSCLEVRVRFG